MKVQTVCPPDPSVSSEITLLHNLPCVRARNHCYVTRVCFLCTAAHAPARLFWGCQFDPPKRTAAHAPAREIGTWFRILGAPLRTRP